MPRRNEEAFKHERAAFEADMAAARAAIEAGDLSRAVDLVVSPSHEFWYSKDPLRFELFHDLYKLIGDPIDESIYRENPWQAKLLAKLYSIWPKTLARMRDSAAQFCRASDGPVESWRRCSGATCGVPLRIFGDEVGCVVPR